MAAARGARDAGLMRRPAEMLRRWRQAHCWDEPPAARLERVLAVLESARAQVSSGWVQGGWWSVPHQGGEAVLSTGFAAIAGQIPGEVEGACLVGALVRGDALLRPDNAEPVVTAAIDTVYDALWAGPGEPVQGWLPVPSPQIRLARVQWLTRWNDAPERCREDVLAVLEGAIAATIQRLVSLPRTHEVAEPAERSELAGVPDAPDAPVAAETDPAMALR